ncbi:MULTISPECIES: SIS domain-containing protein [Neobacillus]|uniref:UPF0309 protein KHA99_07650 n=1 Tax=Neobacillus rhizophilus TaxID=2833579 RepID=A0A942U4K9_9BACI|nr:MULTISPECIES: SIS domain-containing protein [Neobacillus]MBS4212336.1 SIS domain-containing protein [Neobacillus rhizophilus]MBU8915768.1 SIS domain-containing protein [Bacillus sp. FJAT-29953]
MFNQYFKKLKELLTTVEEVEGKSIKAAAHEIAKCIENDGIVHVFGCGHSHMIGEELFYRAGGLVPINPILIEDLMLHKGAVRSSQLEQQNDFADSFMGNISIAPNDVVMIVSTSGRNPVPIDVAKWAKKQKAFVIAITSLAYPKNVSSRHKDGHYLFQAADLVIDNHIPIGDAMMELPDLEVSFGSGSTVVGTAIANGIMAEAVNMMVEHQFTPPIFKSGNADGSAKHNRELINRYKNRIPMLDK